MPYLNGQVPYSVVSVVLASGTDGNGYWEFRCTPAFAARWAFAKREAERSFGRTIYIRAGWNVYRPYDVQVSARKRACASGNCNGASVAGYSSHGGNWGGRDCLAVDVDPNGLTWDQVDQAMEAAGFSARLITEAMSGIKGGERWHYIDFNAFGPVPAGLGATPFEEDDMANADEVLAELRQMYNRQEQINVRREECHREITKYLSEDAARREDINVRREACHREVIAAVTALTAAVQATTAGGGISADAIKRITDAADAAARAGAQSAVDASHKAAMAKLDQIQQEQLAERDREIAGLRAQLGAGTP